MGGCLEEEGEEGLGEDEGSFTVGLMGFDIENEGIGIKECGDSGGDYTCDSQ